MYTYFFNLLLLGLQAIQSIKVENVSELHFMQLTNKLHVTLHLFSKGSQKSHQNVVRAKTWPMSRLQCSVPLMFLPCFDAFVICY